MRILVRILPPSWLEGDMEFVKISAKSDGRRYVAVYRKWFSDKLGAWELELVPGTLRWLD